MSDFEKLAAAHVIATEAQCVGALAARAVAVGAEVRATPGTMRASSMACIWRSSPVASSGVMRRKRRSAPASTRMRTTPSWPHEHAYPNAVSPRRFRLSMAAPYRCRAMCRAPRRSDYRCAAPRCAIAIRSRSPPRSNPLCSSAISGIRHKVPGTSCRGNTCYKGMTCLAPFAHVHAVPGTA